MSYNGWSNYETWAVNLHLTNEEWSDAELNHMVRQHRGPAWKLGDAIKEFVDDILPEVSGLAGDLLMAALSEVNWNEIAENHLTDREQDAA